MANTDKNIIITPNIGSSTADPNIVFTGGNAAVANSVNMTMLASGTLSWDGTAGQLVSITNTASGTMFSVNDTGGGTPSLSVSKDGIVTLVQAAGSVYIGAASGQTSNILSVTGNLYTSGNSYVAQNQFVTGNVVAYGSNDLFGGRVGIGTISTIGANSNILAVYGTTMQFGNVVLRSQAAGTSGIYFADGTFQSSAAGTPTPAGNNTEIQFNNGGAFGASSSLTWNGSTLNATLLRSSQSIGDEGGQIDLAAPAANTTINTGVVIDVYQNRLRFFETGGTNRGFYLDIINGGPGATSNLQVASGGGGPGNYGNANVFSYLSGPIQIGNLTINNTTASTSTLTGALLMGGGAGIQGAVHIGGLIYGASTLNIAGTAQVNSLISNGAVSGTTGTFTGALYGGSFNTAGTATVNALTSNGAVSGTTGTFTSALYGGSFNTAGTATVNALVSNGAISGTTITGTSATVTSLQNSGTETVNVLIANVYGLFGQNVTVRSSNTSTSTTTGALVVTGGAGIGGALHVSGQIYSASTLNIASTAQVNSLISNGAITGTALTVTSLQSSGTATVNSLISNGAISGTTVNGTAGTFTSLQSSGTATVNALTSNGAISGTTITGTAATVTSLQSSGTATVNALISNTDVRTATVNASSTIVGANIYSNGFVQAAGTVTGQSVSSNTTVTAGTGLTVTSGGMTVTGTSSFTGNVNITGNVNVTGAVNSTSSNVLVVQDPLIFVGANNPGDTYDLGIVGSYTEGTYFHTGIVRNASDNFWTVFDTLTGAPNVITGNINWNDSTLTYGPFKAGNIVVVGNTASVGTTTGAMIINGTGGLGVGGRINVGGSAWFAGTVNAGGTAIVNSLSSNGAVSGTTGTFTSALYAGSFNTAGTATVNSLVSNGAISGTTVTGTAGTFTSIQNSGQTLVNSLVANVFARFGQNVEIDSSNASTSSSNGALQVAGGVGISGNLNVGGSNNLFTNRVGIGTSDVLGARANVLAVYGSENLFGNLIIANTAAGGSGIYFPDGSYQQTASAVGGVNQSVQFNDNGLFGGQTNFIYDKTNVRLGIGTTNLTNSLMVFSATPAWFNTTNGADQQIIIGNSTSTGTVIGFNSSSGTGLNTNGYISAIGAAARNISITRTGTGIGGVTLPQNTLEIGGTTIIGSTYSGNNNFINPPSNGLAVQGSVGVGTFTPISILDIRGGGAFTGAVNIGGTATVNALISNGAVSGTTGTFTGALYGGSFNTAGTATVNALVSNGAVSGTTGTFTGALYGGSFNTAGTATVAALVSNGAVSGTTGTFTGALYGGSFNSAGTATVNALVSNGAVSGTAFTATSLQSSGTATVNTLISNVYGLFGQNVTVSSTNASTSTTTGALLLAGGAGIAGAIHVGGLIYGASTLNIAGAAQVNSLVSNGAVSGTTGTFTGALYGGSFNTAGTATVAALVSNGAVSGTTGTFTGALYGGSFNTAGTAIVNALVSNGAVSGTTGTFTGALYGGSFNTAGTATVNALVSNGAVSGTTGTFTGALYGGSFNTAGTATVAALVSNGAISGTTVTATAITATSIQNSGLERSANIVSNTWIHATQNLTVASSNTSTSTTTGAFVLSGGAGIAGATHIGGLIYGASTLNIAGAAQVNSLISNGAVSGTTGTFTGALYGGSFNTAGTATVAALVSNGAVSGTTGTFTGALYGGSFNTAGTATVAALVSNGAVSGTTGTFTGALYGGSFNSAGAAIVQSLNSNTNIVATNLQSTGQTTVASLVSNGAVSGTTGTFTGALYGGSFNTAGTATVNALVSNGAVSGTTGTFTGALYGGSFNTAGTATVAALVSNGAVSGTTGTFTGALYGGSFNTAGTATVAALVSNGAISGTTITGTSATVTSLQNSGLERSANIVSNTWIHATQNLTVASSNTSTSTTTGALVVSGGVGIAGAVHAGGLIYGASTLNIAGAAQVNSLISNGAISGTTISGTSATVTSLQSSGTATVNTLISNVYGLFGQNVTVNSTNASTSTTTGALLLAGGAGIAGAVHAGGLIYGASTLNIAGAAQVNSLISNGAVSGTTGTFTGALYGASFNTAGTATVNALVSNGAVSGTTGTFTGALYGGSFNTAGTATVAALVSNGAVSGTTGTFTGALYGGSFNTAGTATVNALVSNGAVSGTTGTFTGALYGGSFNTAGTATVAALVSNGAITGTTITGTTGTFTSIQNSGLNRSANIVSNTWIHATQNLTVASSNTSTSTTTGALVVSGGVGIAGAVHAGGLIYGASTLNIAGAAQVNSLISNGAVSGTTGTFTGALYGGSFNTAGTATVAALVSNGAVSGTTITGTAGTFTSIQNSGQSLVNSLVANVFARFGQNVEIDSSNASTSSSNGALQVAGGVGISGNVNTGGSRNLFTGAIGVGTTTAAGIITGVGVGNDAYVWGNLRIANTATTSSGIVFADGTIQNTAATGTGGSGTSFGLAGTVQFAGAGNTFTGNSGALFFDNVNNRLGVLTAAPASSLDVRGGVGVTGASNFGATVTVASLASNGAISGTTINGTSTTVTSLQNSGTTTTNALISNVYGLFGQNVTVNSTNVSTSTTTGALLLVGGAGIGGNINVGGANNLFTNRVGIGTSSVLGARANVLAVYGTAEVYGNVELNNPAGGTSGIYFADGTYQTTASGQGIVRQTFTATQGQTTFTVSYVPGAIDVYQNGSKLNVGTDVTATNGTSIVLAISADAGDTIETLSNTLFNVANAIPLTGGTVSGQLTLSTGGGALGLGITPTGWSTVSTNAIELQSPDSGGSTTSVVSLGIDGETAIVRNAYYNGTDWVFRSGGSSALYYQDSGANHVWGSTGTSGIAGNPFGYNTIMTLTPSGSLTVSSFLTSSVTPSIDTTTGGIVTSGGIGIAGNINAGGTRHTFTSNVGIGTTNPRDTLQVFNGNISVGIDTANVTIITPSYIVLSTQGNLPSTPPTGEIQIFSKNLATRSLLTQQGPSGIDTSLQPLIGRNRVYYWSAPGLNTTTAPAVTFGATAFTTVGTATARAFATTNIRTRMTRVAYVSVATAAGLASLRVATAWVTTGTGTGLGGFFYICRFGVSDAATVAGARMFVGLSSNTGAATNVDPAAQLNQLGVAQISTDATQWYFVYGGSAAQTAIALGTTLGAPTLTTTSWDLALFSPPGSDGVIGYTMTNIGTGVSVTGRITPVTPGVQTPANTTALTPQIWRTNNATALAVAIDFMSLYLETDD